MPAATLVAGAGPWPSLGGLDRPGPCGRVKPIKRGFLRTESDVRIVLQHPPRKMPCDRFDYVIRLASLRGDGCLNWPNDCEKR